MGIILFADKSKISSFGTQKGYPVIARIANLDTEIRNGKGFGGGRIVGFLPVVCGLILALKFLLKKKIGVRSSYRAWQNRMG